ncbi:MAG: hypothetical protein K6F14_05435 [Clostridiales bacterium]|nr:hypothetical protein [Clostridiales bacterium]
MKRFLSILLSVLMVVSVLAILASCNGNESKTTTTADQTEATTTAKAQETTTAKTDTTTTQATVTTTATVTETTTAATTTATEKVTTAEVTTVTEAVTTTAEVTTTTEEVTTTIETTSLPVFARFDFGKKTYAEDNGLTSHDYLVSALSYDTACLYIDFYDDYWDIYTVANYDSSNAFTEAFGQKNLRFALIFNDLVTFDFDDNIVIGYGTYSSVPFKSLENIANPVWEGRHQYMRIRIANNTTNNIWSVRFRRDSDGSYFTTCVMGNLYLQGGEPTSSTDLRRTCTASEEWGVYTYDMFLHSGLASGRGHSANRTSGATINLNNWFDYKAYVFEKGDPGGGNISWGKGQSFQSLEFNLFCGLLTYGYADSEFGETPADQIQAYKDAVSQACDTRANIKSGMNVKVDYIIFGSTPEQLDTYKSYLEQA